MALPRYHTCASLPTCRIYVHPFRNSFGLIELCRLSQDTRLTSDSCSSGWSFVIGFLHQGRCLPRLARLTRPSPVRADSGLSPHRHTCAAGRNRVGARGLFPRASSHTTWRTVLVPRGCEQSSECPPSSLFFCLHTLFPLPTSVDRSVPQSSHSEALPCEAFR